MIHWIARIREEEILREVNAERNWHEIQARQPGLLWRLARLLPTMRAQTSSREVCCELYPEPVTRY